MLFPLFLVHLLLSPASSSLSPEPSSAIKDTLPGCPSKCGNISIPYPFGSTPGCHLPGFLITCNTSFDPPRPFITTTNIEVASLSLDAVTIHAPVARDCYAPLGLDPNVGGTYVDVSGLPYTFSYTRNRFTGLGCDTVALTYEHSILDYSSGCVSFCSDPSSILNGTCSGIGCCQTAIPRGLQRVETLLRSLKNHTTSWSFSPCSYAFLVDQQQYVFNLTDLHAFYSRRRVPVALDWAVGEESCNGATAGDGGYACGENSYCTNSTNGPGYRCSCNSGYKGNPYLSNGCQDINECENPTTNPCSDACDNTPGGYICSCPNGFHGDGKKSGNGCIKKSKRFPLLQVLLGSGLGFLFFLVGGTWLHWGLKKRRLIHQKELSFKKNGGLLLQQRLDSHRAANIDTARIFTAAELEAATDSYSAARVLGRGGSGTVYKGVLPDNRVVAIKKSQVIDQTQIEQFINEIVILSQAVHKNVVRILGCCLETPVPLLVYEYVSNGTLHHHIHGRISSLSWEARLRIASETAAALAYLHSSTARPIFHRDVKSSNILLDGSYMAKVSDFGASRLIPLDRAQITTLVQGTLGYLDPEYFQTGQLTEKSDVYSFGVVLAELLTGQRPLSAARPQEEQNLAICLLLRLRERRLHEILEARVKNEGSREQLQAVAGVAGRCLKLKGEERPTMTEVAAELERLRRQGGSHPWDGDGGGEGESLVGRSETAFYTSFVTGNESSDAPILAEMQRSR